MNRPRTKTVSRLVTWTFLAGLLLLPVIKPFNTFLVGYQLQLSDIFFATAAAVFGIAFLVRRLDLRWTNFHAAVAIYAVALTLSTIFSVSPARSVIKLAGEYYLFSLAILACWIMHQQRYLRTVTTVWVVATCLVVLAATAGFILFFFGYDTANGNFLLSGSGTLPKLNFPRISGLFLNANMMCNFLNVSLMFVLLATRLGWIGKRFGAVAQIGTWSCALLTMSPGIGGMILSAGVWYSATLRQQTKLRFAALVLFSAIAAATCFFAVTIVHPDTANTDRDFTIPYTNLTIEPSVRVFTWISSMNTFLEHPLFGKGTGEGVSLVHYQTLSGQRQILTDAHNIWLSILGQAGIVGLLAFAALIIYLLRTCRLWIGEGQETDFARLALSASFIGAFLYQGLVGSFEDARHLWILFGLMAGLASLRDTSKVSTDSSDRPAI